MAFQQEINEIAPWIILQLERRQLSLTEKERQRIINLAIKLSREDRANWKKQIKWELNLIADTRSKIRIISICSVRAINNLEKIKDYLKVIRCELYKDGLGFYTLIPKGYDCTETKKKLIDIWKGKN